MKNVQVEFYTQGDDRENEWLPSWNPNALDLSLNHTIYI